MLKGLVFFSLLIVAEVGLFVVIAGRIGFFVCFLFLALSMIIGLVLTGRKKASLMTSGQQVMPLKVIYYYFIAFLFVFPGFISDLAAYILLIGKFEQSVIDFVVNKLHYSFGQKFRAQGDFSFGDNIYSQPSFSEDKEDNVIDVSYTEVDDKNKKHDK